jgi:hypothetical protein
MTAWISATLSSEHRSIALAEAAGAVVATAGDADAVAASVDVAAGGVATAVVPVGAAGAAAQPPKANTARAATTNFEDFMGPLFSSRGIRESDSWPITAVEPTDNISRTSMSRDEQPVTADCYRAGLTTEPAALSLVDELANMLFALDESILTTAGTTRRLTGAVAKWALGRGWSVRTEAPVAVAASATEGGQIGYVDVVVRRGGSMPDVAIEIDSADKPWSVAKLQHAAAAGMEAIWVRWGDDEWSGVYEDIDVIQLRIRRSADRRSNDGQLAFWLPPRR